MTNKIPTVSAYAPHRNHKTVGVVEIRLPHVAGATEDGKRTLFIEVFFSKLLSSFDPTQLPNFPCVPSLWQPIIAEAIRKQ